MRRRTICAPVVSWVCELGALESLPVPWIDKVIRSGFPGLRQSDGLFTTSYLASRVLLGGGVSKA